MNADQLAGRLCEAIRADRLAHALLITGAVELRLALAQKVMQGLLCRGDAAPCGVCDDCRRIERHIHPAVITLAPVEKKGVTIAQVRDAIASLSEHCSDARIALASDASTLHAQAQNALLKLLEEPPQGVTLLLLGQEADVLPTVRSRCFTVRIAASPARVTDELHGEAVKAWLALCRENANPWDSEPFLGEHKERAARVLEVWTGCAHDMLLLRILGENAPIFNEGQRGALRTCARHFTTPQINGMIEALWEAGKRLQGNANYALLMQWLLLRLLEER